MGLGLLRRRLGLNLRRRPDELFESFLHHGPHILAEARSLGLQVTAHGHADLHPEARCITLWYRLHYW